MSINQIVMGQNWLQKCSKVIYQINSGRKNEIDIDYIDIAGVLCPLIICSVFS